MPIKLNGETGGSVSFDAPDNTSPSGTDVTLTLPTSAGSAGQYLRNSSTAGTLEFGDLPASGLFESYALLEDQKSSGTAAGTPTTGSWLTRDLNTEVADPDGIVSISSNQFTLQAGTYLIQWSAPMYRGTSHVARLHNVTDTANYYGTTEYANQSYYGMTRSFGSVRLTISAAKAFRIEHRCTSASTDGLGRAHGLATEVYTQVQIFKEA